MARGQGPTRGGSAQGLRAECAQRAVPGRASHLSTDYVFDGESPRPYREDDTPRPLNAYGRIKLAGEEEVRRYFPPHIILRTSWIFSAHGQNFVRTILRLARTEPELRVVNGQFGGPTAAADIAKAITKTAVSSEAAPAPIDGLKADVLKIMTSPALRRPPLYHAGVRLQQHGTVDSRDRQVL